MKERIKIMETLRTLKRRKSRLFESQPDVPKVVDKQSVKTIEVLLLFENSKGDNKGVLFIRV